MSQVLGRIAKLSSTSVGKHGLSFSELRFLSTSTTTYLLFKDSNRKRGASGETMVVDMNLYNPMKQERVKIPDQALSEKLCYSAKIGSWRGWVGLENKDDSTIRLTNIYNPCASVSQKVISLPPLDSHRGPIYSFSVSASPNQQEDCVVVAVKTNHSSISLCRPGDSEWTLVKVPFYASEVMYSVRDRRFYLHRMGNGEYDGPVDLIDTSCSDFPQVSMYQSFPLSEIPKSRRDKLFSTSKSCYLVESPSGDSFIVYWYKEHYNTEELKSIIRDKKPPYPYRAPLRIKTRSFLVFRQDPEQKIGCYTEDIGDLCIFLGRNEAFCVSATEYPGLTPNSVYYANMDTGFGFYDLSSGTLHEEVDPAPFSYCYHWLAPIQ